MQAPDIGPDWMWKLIVIFVVIGLLTCCVGLVFGVYWLLSHVKIV